MTEPCIFCGDQTFDWSEDPDEGYDGKRIGSILICTGCLDQLKGALRLGD